MSFHICPDCPGWHLAGEPCPTDERGSHDPPRHFLGRLGHPATEAPTLSQSVTDRFWVKVEVADDGCWNWTACRNPKGYGLFGLFGRNTSAHRLAYEITVGPIPGGLTLDHLCRNRRCVNPAHLEPVTNWENISRGNAPSARNARKTECHLGHPLSGDNLYVAPNGMRVCRTCRQVRRRTWRQRRTQAGLVAS